VDFKDINPLVAGIFSDDGEFTAAERRLAVMTQWRDRFGRWVEMGRCWKNAWGNS